jgi:hypothetical protein
MAVALLPQAIAPPLVDLTSSQVAPPESWRGQEGRALKPSSALV